MYRHIRAIQKCIFNHKHLQHLVATKLHVKGNKTNVQLRTFIMNTKHFYFTTLVLTQKQRLMNAFPHLFLFNKAQGVLRNCSEPHLHGILANKTYIKTVHRESN